MGVHETLLPDVMAPGACQNDCRYVRELSGLILGSVCKNLAWWAVTQRTSKTKELSKLKGGHLHRNGHLPGTIQCCTVKHNPSGIFHVIYHGVQ